jgi:hypothetical protein
MTGRDRRAVRWGLRLILGGVLCLRVVPWATRASIDAIELQRLRRAHLARARAEVAGLSTLEDSARVLTARLGGAAERLLSGSTESAALSDMAARLQDLARRSRARMDRMESVPDSTTAGRLRRITVRAGFEGDARGLVQLLATLGAETPLIVPSQLRVVARDPLEESRATEVLQFDIEAAGWFLEARQ